MRLLRALNSSVADLASLFFWPVREGEERELNPPLWARAAMGWALIVLFFAGFTWLR